MRKAYGGMERQVSGSFPVSFYHLMRLFTLVVLLSLDFLLGHRSKPIQLAATDRATSTAPRIEAQQRQDDFHQERLIMEYI
ncbi:hypothetical protein BDP81DRAFT_425824 [Colletotrichum phormii]|uniref:Uncharacterized protein n=1 Tax=Colletotrichum phormii TaxID=359342 RepID=A0AAI9ZVS3_9PEZI|nr:uncharacterized protein BDP81DRAFT_425824 [Colletotrichum phormii]KAK1637754.1 hypothetical protein BDP81DRAFT_425824 [Colletotrichum phormii]